MLVPAITRKKEILTKFKDYFYTQDMMYETGSICNWIPDISEEPNNRCMQYAVVNNDGKLIGYIGYYIDWYTSCAKDFGIISFDRGNPIFGKDLFSEMNKIIKDYKVHRIEWRMLGGNPIEKQYDKFCKIHNGKKFVLTDSMKDRCGKYHNEVIYEIILEGASE